MSSILKVSEIQDPTNGNTALSIDSSGRVFNPEVPAILAQGKTEGNVTFANLAPVTFTLAADKATYSKGITLVSETRFTVPVTGLYFASFTVYVNDANTARRFQWRQNGAFNNPHGGLEQSGAGAARSVSVTQIMDLSANDYIEVVNASGGNVITYNGNNHTFASMFLIG